MGAGDGGESPGEIKARSSDGPPERRRDEPDPVAAEFVLRLGRSLQCYGLSSQRLEDLLGATAERLGLSGHQFFSTPTSIMASFGPVGRQRTHMLRTEPGEVNLGKLAELERLGVEVAEGRSTPAEGSAAIDRIAAAPSPYGPALTTVAFGLVSGAACQFLGGGGREVLAASLLGLGLGFLALLTGALPRLGGVFEPLAAFLVSAGAIGMAHLLGPMSVLIATLAGLIVLLPGLTLTTAMTELATRHLASGVARLSGAFSTFLTLAFGVALGNRVGTEIFGAAPAAAAASSATWASLVALVLAPLCFTVILRAEPRDAPWIVLAGALGVLGGRIGAATFGVELGTFAGSFAVALAGNLYERWRRRPAAVIVVPGILLLVPGSVGFRSLTSLIEREALTGIETAFSMILTAIALVAGMLVAGVIVPERRIGGGA
jgi:uncharacterized membrane protein YjjP (DUF1212 family)